MATVYRCLDCNTVYTLKSGVKPGCTYCHGVVIEDTSRKTV